MFKPDISRALARRIAQTHSLELPIKKEPSWLLDRIEGFDQASPFRSTLDLHSFLFIYSKYRVHRFMKISALVSANSFASDEDKALHGRFLSTNLSTEYDELKRVIQSLPSDNMVFVSFINIRMQPFVSITNRSSVLASDLTNRFSSIMNK